MAVKKGLNLLTKIGHLWLKKNILRAMLISIITALTQIILIVLFFSQLPPKVPLFYSRPWGNTQLADPLHLFFLPGSSILVLIINSIVAAMYIDHEEFYSYCLSWVSSIFSIFCLITLVKIISIVI